jgi:hypothetical protein
MILLQECKLAIEVTQVIEVTEHHAFGTVRVALTDSFVDRSMLRHDRSAIQQRIDQLVQAGLDNRANRRQWQNSYPVVRGRGLCVMKGDVQV